MAAILNCAMTEALQCSNSPELSFSWKKYAEKRYYKGKYYNFFISYNISIVSGGHFEFLQIKHEWGFKT